MTLRTRTEAAPARSWLPPSVRARIPISRIPQPRENRMTSSWRQAKPGRIAASLAVSQAQNSGGWFVAGQSTDVGPDRVGHPDHRRPRGGVLAQHRR